METKNTLVTIIKDHFAMEELLTEVGGELDADSEKWLKENIENLSLKADGYKKAIDFLENASEYLKSKAEPFTSAAKTCANKADALRDRMKWAMRTLNMTSVEGQEYTFSLSNKGKKVVVIDEKSIPALYFDEVVTLVLNKEKLMKDLEEGKTVDGVRLEDIIAMTTKVTSTKIESKKKGKK